MKKKTDFSHLYREEVKYHYTSAKSYSIHELVEVVSRVSDKHKVVSLVKGEDGISISLYATKQPIIESWVQTQGPASIPCHEVAIRIKNFIDNLFPTILTMLSHPSLMSMDVVNDKMFAQTSIIAKLSVIGDEELKELVAHWQLQQLPEKFHIDNNKCGLLSLMVNGVDVVAPGYYYSIDDDGDDNGGEDGFKPPRSNRHHYR